MRRMRTFPRGTVPAEVAQSARQTWQRTGDGAPEGTPLAEGDHSAGRQSHRATQGTELRPRQGWAAQVEERLAVDL